MSLSPWAGRQGLVPLVRVQPMVAAGHAGALAGEMPEGSEG
jgi:hypothetical protein